MYSLVSVGWKVWPLDATPYSTLAIYTAWPAAAPFPGTPVNFDWFELFAMLVVGNMPMSEYRFGIFVAYVLLLIIMLLF